MLLDIITSTKIGIFYLDKGWKDDVYEKIRADALKCETLKYFNKNEICFADKHIKICIYFYPVDNNVRGCRFDRVYYQQGIDRDVLLSRAAPKILTRMYPLDV